MLPEDLKRDEPPRWRTILVEELDINNDLVLQSEIEHILPLQRRLSVINLKYGLLETIFAICQC